MAQNVFPVCHPQTFNLFKASLHSRPKCSSQLLPCYSSGLSERLQANLELGSSCLCDSKIIRFSLTRHG